MNEILQKSVPCADGPGAIPGLATGGYMGRDPFTAAKDEGTAYLPPDHYDDIHLPENNAMAVASGLVAGFLVGFGLVWQIWWLVIVAVVIGIASIVWYGAARMKHKTIPARVVQDDTERWLKSVHDTVADADAGTDENSNTSVNPGRTRRNEYGVIGVE